MMSVYWGGAVTVLCLLFKKSKGNLFSHVSRLHETAVCCWCWQACAVPKPLPGPVSQWGVDHGGEVPPAHLSRAHPAFTARQLADPRRLLCWKSVGQCHSSAPSCFPSPWFFSLLPFCLLSSCLITFSPAFISLLDFLYITLIILWGGQIIPVVPLCLCLIITWKCTLKFNYNLGNLLIIVPVFLIIFY